MPKPSPSRIREMTYDYYQEQARFYDNFDRNNTKRKAFTQRIEQLIAADIRKRQHIKNMLSVACGTGRRALKIRKLSGREFEITGVDMSEKMGHQAAHKGITTYTGRWLDVSLQQIPSFDVATCLYSFGHIPEEKERFHFLEKLNRALVKNGVFYLDVFNLDDKNEWGPLIKEKHEKEQLHKAGYQLGDVFYKKAGGDAVGFLHYFTISEMTRLLEKSGFSVETVYHIGYEYKPGMILERSDEGILFFKAIKKQDTL